MRYFDLYEFPVQLLIDQAVLRKKYLELSRRYHPDYFIGEESNAQQQALQQSALVNNAFKTFTNRDETIKYVLEQKSLLTENEKYILPSDFLMEMLELNEAVADAQFDAVENTTAMQRVVQLEQELYQAVHKIIETYKEGVTTKAELLEIKDYYYKKKYLERLKQQLGEKS